MIAISNGDAFNQARKRFLLHRYCAAFSNGHQNFGKPAKQYALIKALILECLVGRPLVEDAKDSWREKHAQSSQQSPFDPTIYIAASKRWQTADGERGRRLDGGCESSLSNSRMGGFAQIL